MYSSTTISLWLICPVALIGTVLAQRGSSPSGAQHLAASSTSSRTQSTGGTNTRLSQTACSGACWEWRLDLNAILLQQLHRYSSACEYETGFVSSSSMSASQSSLTHLHLPGVQLRLQVCNILELGMALVIRVNKVLDLSLKVYASIRQ